MPMSKIECLDFENLLNSQCNDGFHYNLKKVYVFTKSC